MQSLKSGRHVTPDKLSHDGTVDALFTDVSHSYNLPVTETTLRLLRDPVVVPSDFSTRSVFVNARAARRYSLSDVGGRADVDLQAIETLFANNFAGHPD